MPTLLPRKIVQADSVFNACMQRPSPSVHWVGIFSLYLRGYIWVHLRYGLLFCQLGTYDPLLPERRSLELPGRIG